MATAYPGRGRTLYVATYTGGAGTNTSQVTYPLNAVIATSALSDSEATNDAQALSLTITYNVVPTAVTTIQFDVEPTFTDPITLDTLPASATDKIAVWSTTGNYLLPGFIRVSNTSDVQINSVVVQKQVASVG